MATKSNLSKEDKEKIERNRQQALSIRMKKSGQTNNVVSVKNLKKTLINIDGTKFIDSNGGFLIEESVNKTEFQENAVSSSTFDFLDEEPYVCKECGKEYITSYLQSNFDYSVCDECRDEEVKHTLITKSDARVEYLLKDCDFELREPPLKFISRKNPHNVRWGEMKLYLLLQVEKRAIEVWGSLEKLEEAHKIKNEKHNQQKQKMYNKKFKALKMAVRSSLYDRTTGPTHQHEFGTETYNENDDTYSKSCKTCSFIETYEKMIVGCVRGCCKVSPHANTGFIRHGQDSLLFEGM